jgi:hypothetical protein
MKMTSITTTTIVTTTSLICPANVPLFLFLGSGREHFYHSPEPQTSNVDPIAGGIGGVVVAIVVVVILVFIR